MTMPAAAAVAASALRSWPEPRAIAGAHRPGSRGMPASVGRHRRRDLARDRARWSLPGSSPAPRRPGGGCRDRWPRRWRSRPRSRWSAGIGASLLVWPSSPSAPPGCSPAGATPSGSPAVLASRPCARVLATSSAAVATPARSSLTARTPTPVPTPTPTPAGRQARILGITVSDGRYVVDYDIFNYSARRPRSSRPLLLQHVTPAEAGVPPARARGSCTPVRSRSQLQGQRSAGQRDADVHPRRQLGPLGHPGHRQLFGPPLRTRDAPTDPGDLATGVRASPTCAGGRRGRSRRRPSRLSCAGSMSRFASRSPAGSRPASRRCSTPWSVSAWRRPTPASAPGS